MTQTTVSFENDILPIFYKWKTRMTWRLDLTKYEDVKENASIIYDNIASKQMPPPPFPPLTDEQIEMFKEWMNTGYAK
jgi:hypothetical protein